jgi:hypothetical protein
MRHFKQIAIIGGLALAGLATAGALRAFPNASTFGGDPSQDIHCGSGDIYGTGSQHDWGIQCSHCHINNKNQQGNLSAKFVWSPALGAGNTYQAGVTYNVTATMTSALANELGISVPNQNKNGIAVIIEDSNGTAAGNLLGDFQTSCPATFPLLNGNVAPDPYLQTMGASSGSTFAYGDCHAVSSLGFYNPAPTSWRFKWKAPSTAGQALTLYYGIVDGDADQTSLGDDVKQGKIQLQ